MAYKDPEKLQWEVSASSCLIPFNFTQETPRVQRARDYCDRYGLDKRTHVRALIRLLGAEWDEGYEEARDTEGRDA